MILLSWLKVIQSQMLRCSILGVRCIEECSVEALFDPGKWNLPTHGMESW